MTEDHPSTATNSAAAQPVVKIPVTTAELFTLFTLGIFIGAAFCIARLLPSFLPIAAYFGCMSLFHALEYLVTAAHQPKRVGFECKKYREILYQLLMRFLAFLLDHSTEYTVALVSAICEYMLESWMFPRFKSWLCIFRYIGLLFALGGQMIRTAAMHEAADNFSHLIFEKKHPGHKLVTTGVYKYMRHPAYTGFFFWTLGVQMVLGNPICFGVFFKALSSFFEERIKYEEETLVKFFGPEYSKYKSMTWSGFFTIP